MAFRSQQPVVQGPVINDNNSLYVYANRAPEKLVRTYFDDVVKGLASLDKPIQTRYILYPTEHVDKVTGVRSTNFRVFFTNSAAYHLLIGRDRGGQESVAPVLLPNPWPFVLVAKQEESEPVSELELTSDQVTDLKELRHRAGNVIDEMAWSDAGTRGEANLKEKRQTLVDALLMGAPFELLVQQPGEFEHPNIYYLPPEEIRENGKDWQDILTGERTNDIVIERAKRFPIANDRSSRLLVINIKDRLSDKSLADYPAPERYQMIEKEIRDVAKDYSTSHDGKYPLVRACGIHAYIEFVPGKNANFAHYMLHGAPLFGGTKPVLVHYGTKDQDMKTMDQRCVRGRRGDSSGQSGWAPRGRGSRGTDRPWHRPSYDPATAYSRPTYAMDPAPSRRGQQSDTARPSTSTTDADGWTTSTTRGRGRRGRGSSRGAWQ